MVPTSAAPPRLQKPQRKKKGSSGSGNNNSSSATSNSTYSNHRVSHNSNSSWRSNGDMDGSLLHPRLIDGRGQRQQQHPRWTAEDNDDDDDDERRSANAASIFSGESPSIHTFCFD